MAAECHPGFLFKESWLATLPPESSDLALLLNSALHSDISDFAMPSPLGDHLSDKCHVIRRPVFLQVDEVVDISLALEDRQQIRSAESGTLKFLLSDGRFSIIGVSKKRMASLSPSSIPGIKISLRPPVEMRYGVLFLDDDKVQVEGGHSPPLVRRRDFIFHSERAQAVGQFLSSDEEDPGEH
jgi:hypothetical protein